MQQLYARVFVKILDSSLAENYQARHIFEDLLKLAHNGVVDMTRQAISRRINVPIGIVNDAIAYLEAPDPSSRDDAEGGCRLKRLDDHRDWGWYIVNWDKYEAIKCFQDERSKVAERVRRHRLRKAAISPTPPLKETETDTDTEGALQNVTRRYCNVTGVTEALHSSLSLSSSEGGQKSTDSPTVEPSPPQEPPDRHQDENSYPPATPPLPPPQKPPIGPSRATIEAWHAEWERMTGQRMPLNAQTERYWYDWGLRGHSIQDLRSVIMYLQRLIADDKGNPGSLKLRNLLSDRFEENLGQTTLRLKPPPIQPSSPPPAPEPPPKQRTPEETARIQAQINRMKQSLGRAFQTVKDDSNPCQN